MLEKHNNKQIATIPCVYRFIADAQTQLATAQEKERAATEKSLELSSKLAALESQVSNYRQEKSRIEAELEVERTKLEELEDFKSKCVSWSLYYVQVDCVGLLIFPCRESGKLEAFKMKHKKEMDTLTIEKVKSHFVSLSSIQV